MKQVLKSANTSTIINELIKNYSQRMLKNDYNPVPQRDSENHPSPNSSLERPEVLKIEDRVQCHTANVKDQATHFVHVE